MTGQQKALGDSGQREHLLWRPLGEGHVKGLCEVDLLYLCRCDESKNASVYLDLSQAPVSGTGWEELLMCRAAGLQRATLSYLKLGEDGKILDVKEKQLGM